MEKFLFVLTKDNFLQFLTLHTPRRDCIWAHWLSHCWLLRNATRVNGIDLSWLVPNSNNHTLLGHLLAPYQLPYLSFSWVLHLHMQSKGDCPHSVKPWPCQNCSVGWISINYNEFHLDPLIAHLYRQLNHPLRDHGSSIKCHWQGVVLAEVLKL